jgi:hypothetical protein
MAARHHFEEQLLASRQVLVALVIFDDPSKLSLRFPRLKERIL